MGIAKTTTSDGKNFVVANYSPAGNVKNQFAANVQRDPNQNDVKNSDLCKKSTTSPQGTGTTTNTGSTGGTTGGIGTTYLIPVGRTLSSRDEKKLQDCVSTLGTVKTESWHRHHCKTNGC